VYLNVWDRVKESQSPAEIETGKEYERQLEVKGKLEKCEYAAKGARVPGDKRHGKCQST